MKLSYFEHNNRNLDFACLYVSIKSHSKMAVSLKLKFM